MTIETAAAAGPSLVGHCIDERYRLEAEIGVGGLGTVYRAMQTKLQRAVAVKLLHESYGGNAVQRGRFEREARALATLEHSNIVSVLDYGVSENRPYLVMELLEGETLSQHLKRGPLPIRNAVSIAQQMLSALAFMHSGGLVHRDLKPSNVFLQRIHDGQERVKVLDFGLAKFTAPTLAGADPTLTRDGSIVGTPAYMSPEQATGEMVDARGDVYAVGVILFQMLSGHLPFEGDAFEQVRSHLVALVPPLGRVGPDRGIDSALNALIQRAMSKRRDERFADGGEMLDALSMIFPQTRGGSITEFEAVSTVQRAARPESARAGEADSAVELLTSEQLISVSSHATRVHRPAKLRKTLRSLLVTSVRVIATVSVLLVLGTAGIVVLLFRENDRADLVALQQRVSARVRARGSHEAVVVPPGKEPIRSTAAPEHDVQVAEPPPIEEEPHSIEHDVPPPEQELVSPEPALPVAPPSAAGALAHAAWAVSPLAREQSESVSSSLDDDRYAANPLTREPATSSTPPPSLPSARATASTGEPPVHERPAPRATLQLMAAHVSAGNTAPGPPAARNPWLRAVPRELRAAHKLAASGTLSGERQAAALRAYDQEHPEDPRGHLLLAQLYYNRTWRPDAIEQLSAALQLDLSARGAPEVLSTLLALVVQGKAANEAQRLIVKAYGSEALPAIESALAKEKDAKAVARLRGLIARLTKS